MLLFDNLKEAIKNINTEIKHSGHILKINYKDTVSSGLQLDLD